MYSVRYNLVFYILVLMFKYSLVQGSLPDYIHVCHRNDPEIIKCIEKSVEILRPKLREGIPELNVPPIEPMPLESISLQQGAQGARVNLNLTQIYAWGPSSFIQRDIKPNIAKNIFEFKILIPNLHFKGKYSINMNVILLKVNGRGNISGNFSNFVGHVKMQGQKMYNASSGTHHLKFNKIRINLKIGPATLKLDGLFGGNQILGRVANEILEDNAAVFVEEIRPAMERSLEKVFLKISNGITGSFTYDELFPL